MHGGRYISFMHTGVCVWSLIMISLLLVYRPGTSSFLLLFCLISFEIAGYMVRFTLTIVIDCLLSPPLSFSQLPFGPPRTIWGTDFRN